MFYSFGQCVSLAHTFLLFDLLLYGLDFLQMLICFMYRLENLL